MRHNKAYRKLNRQRSHYRATMRNLAFSLLHNERIKTTVSKAKEVQGFVEKIITLGKKGGLHNRRRALSLLGNKVIHAREGKTDVVGKVFTDLSERFKGREGGYTRILRLGRLRAGDAAEMVIFELVDFDEQRAKKEKKAASESGDSAKTAEATEKPAKKVATAKKATKKKATKKKAAKKKSSKSSDGE